MNNLKAVFVLLLAGICFGNGLHASDTERVIPVSVKKPVQMTFENIVQATGTLRAKNLTIVSPRVPGVIEKIFVDEGDTTVAGETKLFQTDSLKLEKALEIARQNLAVASCALSEKEAAIAQIEIELKRAESEYMRYKQLSATNAVSADSLESKQSAFEKQKASKIHAQTVLALTREEKKKAEIAVGVAEKDYKDSLAIAPISGKIVKRMIEPGQMGAAGVAAMRIEDTINLEARVFVPGQYYGAVIPGKTRIRLSFFDKTEEYTIVFKSPTIDTTLRTFEIRCDVTGDNFAVVPGAVAHAEIIIDSHRGIGIPRSCILIRGGKNVVFAESNSKTVMIPVETGLETGDMIEIIGNAVSTEQNVIVRGQFLLENGSAVSVQKGE